MFNFHDTIDGGFAVLVTWLGNTEPVGTTEIGMLSKLKEEFKVVQSFMLTRLSESASSSVFHVPRLVILK